jgi:hypothetical protein
MIKVLLISMPKALYTIPSHTLIKITAIFTVLGAKSGNVTNPEYLRAAVRGMMY